MEDTVQQGETNMTNMINVISMLHNITYNSMNVKKKRQKA